MDRLIFHVDVNSAYLSWEATRQVARGGLDPRTVPAAIGGARDKRTGVILAKSIPAKRFGVRTGEPVAMALRKCPEQWSASASSTGCTAPIRTTTAGTRAVPAAVAVAAAAPAARCSRAVPRRRRSRNNPSRRFPTDFTDTEEQTPPG